MKKVEEEFIIYHQRKDFDDASYTIKIFNTGKVIADALGGKILDVEESLKKDEFYSDEKKITFKKILSIRNEYFNSIDDRILKIVNSIALKSGCVYEFTKDGHYLCTEFEKFIEFENKEFNINLNSNMNINDIINILGYYASFKMYKNKNINNFSFEEGKNLFKVDNGYLINDKGVYGSGLTFITDKLHHFKYFDDYYTKEKYLDEYKYDFDGKNDFMFGDFYISKKGSPCFKVQPQEKAKHILIRTQWGQWGCTEYSKTRGNENYWEKIKNDLLYYKFKRSHGYGQGYRFVIIPVEKKEPSRS